MPRNMPPATVASHRDLVEYYISDASPVDSTAPRGYLERCIHSEIYKKYPTVNGVIHSHSHAVVPYTISGVPLRPCFHMAGFLGQSTPVFNIAEHYQSGDIQDLLIREVRLGEALASHFGKGSKDEPLQAVVLMRGHGFTTVASSPEECIFRAIYTQDNAGIQTTSLALNAGLARSSKASSTSIPEVHYLSDDEVAAATGMGQNAWTRAWSLWVREVQADPLYVIDD
ncbi:hypothetical protein LTR84_012834 [Exophiala bonariae]|uniref:Class II aldolase/adducin N-terminal domain-containing protein n=1 Tax=Exophiala bonariae TaxID=1690606 RepID=A0AAV9NDD9_9EURO|nr:hypothetical protein LTR84_012834 [Exophiala bonariae]